MSPSRRRRRRIREPSEGGSDATGKKQQAPPPLPEWKWRTMPVFIALSAGLFVGLYLGMVATGTGIAATVIFLVVAGMLGISVSRYVMRLLMQRGIIKPQARRR
ncbi:MAG: hypothetical protein F4Y97_02065 [Dehalococcoidia bacterium]|nr:hypothetical protein [Chloroflexota bacterium]MXY71806.1 hypothetical protein [Dehalococcoidia bacterium]